MVEAEEVESLAALGQVHNPGLGRLGREPKLGVTNVPARRASLTPMSRRLDPLRGTGRSSSDPQKGAMP